MADPQLSPIQLVRALRPAGEPGPALANRALRERALAVLGTDPVEWAGEIGRLTTELVLERNADRVLPYRALSQLDQELLLALLLTIAGRPAPPGIVAITDPELLRAAVEQQVSVDRLVGTARLVQHFWIDRLRASAVRLGARPEVQQSLVLTVTQFMDARLDATLKDYAAELSRLRQTASAERGRLVEDLVGGREVDAARAAGALGIGAHDYHLGAVLSTPDHTAFGTETLRMRAAALITTLGAATSVRHEPAVGTLWLWVSDPGRLDLAVLDQPGRPESDGVRVGVGSVHPQAGGFRRSHLEALDAERFARLGTRSGVVLHRDVALAALLAHDPERAGWFVETQLGELADPDHADLRSSLVCYYRAQMRLAVAAAALPVHRNTLIQRLRRIETLLGHPVGERVPEVLCALLLRDLLSDPR